MMSADDDTPAAVAAADEAYEAVKILASTTLWATAQPGPEVYQVLGNVKLLAGPMIAETLKNLGDGLARALEDPTIDVYQDDAGDPGIAAMNTVDYLNQAAAKAVEVGRLLEAAQGAIARQGYNRPPAKHGDQVNLERPDGTYVRGTWHHEGGDDPYLVDDDGTRHAEYTQPSGAGRRNIIERGDG